MQTRFAHIRDSAAGPYTIAFTEIPRGTTGEVHYAIARCNPRDNFCKKIGRTIAEGRLASGNYKTVYVNSSNFGEIKRTIAESLDEENVSHYLRHFKPY